MGFLRHKYGTVSVQASVSKHHIISTRWRSTVQICPRLPNQTRTTEPLKALFRGLFYILNKCTNMQYLVNNGHI